MHNLEINRLKGRVDALKTAGWHEKTAMAEAALDKAVEIMAAQSKQIDLLISRLDGIQHGKAAQIDSPA